MVIEVRQFDQYVVRVDGSGRVTLRNRKFQRKYIPAIVCKPYDSLGTDLTYKPVLPAKHNGPPSTAGPNNSCSMKPTPYHNWDCSPNSTPNFNMFNLHDTFKQKELVRKNMPMQREMKKLGTALPDTLDTLPPPTHKPPPHTRTYTITAT